ncbi:MAG: Na+/proline symporter [Proteobacteria bacterium]|nr:Na+/proline symporter [Pseudomonadota bacterium]
MTHLDPALAVMAAPWAVLVGYGLLVWAMSPRRASPVQFFAGRSEAGAEPGLWLLVFSAAITWIFAKSIANAADLGKAFGLVGGVGYGVYYLSFLVAGLAIYLIRARGGHASLSAFLVAKYGPVAARFFLVAVAIRLFNEVWSNTKVGALYFGAEGSLEYWIAVAAITGFTLYYSWVGGLRSSLVTDGGQMVMAAVLLVVILIVVMPPLAAQGLPAVAPEVGLAGLTFAALAAVQVLSYPFHDPVLTDRGFLTRPRTMLAGFVLAGLIGGAFIVLFSLVGVYARALGLSGAAAVAVPTAFGLPMLLVFNAIMLTSAGSTLDSTFASSAKLAARDWGNVAADPGEREKRIGRWVMIAIAVAGNLPLLGIYLGDRAGPAIIAATTISGTMMMGLAPIFLLSFLPTARRASFHLAFWPGIALGAIMTLEGAAGLEIMPAWIDLGVGAYADDLGVNVFGLALCTTGYLAGAARLRRTWFAARPVPALGQEDASRS